jgi:hypothetical protein
MLSFLVSSTTDKDNRDEGERVKKKERCCWITTIEKHEIERERARAHRRDHN